MKKKLLSLVVLASCSGSSFAQTTVIIYGLVDAGITAETGGTAGSVLKLATGVQSGNRLGFKGTEDLGSGLKANFHLETGFELDDGKLRQGGALFGRQAHVGLSGSFGSINLGRNYNPFFVALDGVDPFGTGLPGSTTNLMNGSSVRTNNSISYSSAPMGGFSANIVYGLGEVAGSSAKSRAIDFSVSYLNGPLVVALAYDSLNNDTDTNLTKLTLLGGKYNFGVATLHLAYETEKNDVGMDFRDMMAGVTVPVGAGSFMASYIKKTDKSVAGNAGAKQFAFGYTYAMSQRTNLYTGYGRINNDAGATAKVGDASGGGSAPVAGNSSSAFTVGVRHKF
jgi:predicted porin